MTIKYLHSDCLSFWHVFLTSTSDEAEYLASLFGLEKRIFSIWWQETILSVLELEIHISLAVIVLLRKRISFDLNTFLIRENILLSGDSSCKYFKNRTVICSANFRSIYIKSTVTRGLNICQMTLNSNGNMWCFQSYLWFMLSIGLWRWYIN
jgi:hypothetical protein